MILNKAIQHLLYQTSLILRKTNSWTVVQSGIKKYSPHESGYRKFPESSDHQRRGNIRLVLWPDLCSLKITCWSHNPPSLRMCLYLETGPLKWWLSLKKAVSVRSNAISLVSLWEDEIWTHSDTPGAQVQRRKTTWGTAQKQPSASLEERPPKKPKLSTPWSLTFHLQNCEKNIFALFKAPNLWYFAWQP